MRGELPIDWVLVDNLLMAGCTGTEIAPHFAMHPNTLYNRTEKEFGLSFCEYSQQKKAQGEACLRAQQYMKAMGKTDIGDSSMLIWLGKNRLDQRDKPKEDDTPQDAQMSTLLDTIKMLHANNEKIKELEEKLKQYESNARVD